MESLANERYALRSRLRNYQLRSSTTTNPAAASAAANVSPTNGVPPNAANSRSTAAADPNGLGALVVHTGTVSPGVPSAQEVPKRKRGRPRKYPIPEQANGTSLAAPSSLPRAASRGGGGQAFRSSQPSPSPPLGESTKGLTPHTIHVAAGEDVGKKIMLFLQERKSDVCIISARGTISIACLFQPSPSGGITKYEGKFKILSLTGSFVHPRRGARTGGICVSLVNPDGQIIGGRVNSHLIAGGPTQVVVATFVVDPKRIFCSKGGRAETSAPVGRSPAPSFGFQSMDDSSHPAPSSQETQSMKQPLGMESHPLYLQWSGSTDK